MTDPIADLLIQIKNGYLARKEKAVVPYSTLKDAIVKLLSKEGFVGKANVIGEKIRKSLEIELLYTDKNPGFTQVVKISKPGKKVYVSKRNIPKVLGGLGVTIISTSSGIMTDREARKKGLGGELICKIW